MYEKIQNVINQISVEGNFGLFNQSLTEEERQYFWNNIVAFNLSDNLLLLMINGISDNNMKATLVTKLHDDSLKIDFLKNFDDNLRGIILNSFKSFDSSDLRYDEVIKYFYKDNSDSKDILHSLINNSIIIKFLFEKKNYDLLSKFNVDNFLFYLPFLPAKEQEVLIGYTSDIVKYINELGYVPNTLKNSNIIFQRIWNSDNYALITEFSKNLLNFNCSVVINKDKLIKIAKYIESLETVPENLKGNVDLLNYFISNNKLDLAFQFDELIITDDIINKNIEKIANYIIKTSNVPKCLENNIELLNYFINNNRLDIAFKFNSDLFNSVTISDDIINKNIEKIANYIIKTNNVPIYFYNNFELLNYFISNNRLDIAFKFNRDLFNNVSINDGVIRNNLEKIVEYIRKSNYIPNCFRSSTTLLGTFLKNNDFDKAFMFNETAFTNDVINENYEIIINYIKHLGKIPQVIYDNAYLFDKCLNDNKFDIVFEFYFDLFSNDEIVNKYLEKIAAYIKDNYIYIKKFYNSKALFNYYIKKNDFDKAYILNPMFFNNNDIVRQHLDEIIKYVGNDGNKIPIYCDSLFEYYLSNDNFTMALKFSSDLFKNEKIISKYLKKIGEYIEYLGKIPEQIKSSKILFNYFLIEHPNLELVVQFSLDLFTEEVISEHYDVVKDAILKSNETVKFEHLKRIFIKRNDYDLLKFMTVDKSVYKDLELFPIICEMIATHKKNITSEQVKEKFEWLFSKNNELYFNFNPAMLGTDIPIKFIEKLASSNYLQRVIVDLNENEQYILCQILEFFDNTKYDICSVIYNILKNIDTYGNLLNDLKSKKLTDDELKTLITILSNKNDLNINSYNELIGYDNLILNEHNSDIKKIFNGEELPNILEKIFRYKYGLSLDDAKFLDERYCSDITIVRNGKLPDKLKSALLDIHKILNISDEEQLKFIFLTSSILKTDFYSTILLESSIRGCYAEEYSDTLYKLKDSDKLTSENVPVTAYTTLNSVSYNGQKPEVYVLHDDFNLQIHVLGAYRSWERPKNFKDDWNRPQMSYHGICTSYIGNNEIANARQYHPTYGFSHYEQDSLLCAGPQDLNSDTAIYDFASSRKNPYEFLPPKEMIDKTRHTHNEMVLERRNTSANNNNFKRMPDYVVYFVDDINNLANFNMDKNNLFSETVQAAIDQDIPIVIVDRLYYAKREKAKCNALLEQFKNSLDVNTLKELLTQIANNMIGCAYYDTQTRSAYHDEFAANYLHGVIDKIILSINKKPLNIQTGVIKALNSIVDNDYLLKADEYLVNKLNCLNNIISQVQIDNDKKENTNNQINIGNYLVDYYKNASPDIREQIKKDIEENELDYQAIYQKIINGEYETRMKGI